MSLTHKNSSILLGNKLTRQHTICQSFSRSEGVGLKVKLNMVVLWSGRVANISFHKMKRQLDKSYGIIPVDQKSHIFNVVFIV